MYEQIKEINQEDGRQRGSGRLKQHTPMTERKASRQKRQEESTA
jgi:hypothetical protein